MSATASMARPAAATTRKSDSTTAMTMRRQLTPAPVEFLMELYQRPDGRPIEPDQPREAARRIGISEEAITQCLANAKLRADVESLTKRLARVGVRAMPTYYINGEKVEGSWPLEVFEKKIEAMLTAAGVKR